MSPLSEIDGPKRRSPSIVVPAGSQPIGYSRLIQQYALPVVLPAQLSFVGGSSVRREILEKPVARIVYPPGYAVEDTVLKHLQFSFKHDGISLEILAALFRSEAAPALEAELVAALKQQPHAAHFRRIWFFFEWMTGTRLPIPDLKRGSYLPLLDPAGYYTGPPRRVRRQRLFENLLGNLAFSPMVRRTETLESYQRQNPSQKVTDLMGRYDRALLQSAVNWLYRKETRSSFAIEGETPGPARVERFVALLQQVSALPSLAKDVLVRLQNETVDERFANPGYRPDQVYVAPETGLARQRIEYVAPKPEDVAALMEGLLSCSARLAESAVDPVVQAAVVSFGFVFIHPFSDGNGRLHRLLIHYVLSRARFTPAGLIFPVSAVMQAKSAEYDECLESFSIPLLQVVDYREHEDGSLTVHGETSGLYRYFDATRMAEDLYRWVSETIETEFVHELDYLDRFRKARASMLEVVDLPDKQLNLFVKLVRANRGVLSAAKQPFFSMLLPAEIQRLEQIIRDNLLTPTEQATDAARVARPPRQTHSSSSK
jgi:hypothetical protein